jgi:NADP-dependent 3-hydroxy acid dehydrogenase YdfG
MELEMEQHIYAGLRGKTALVTGAGSGIGAALAKRFGSLGVRVICVGRTKKTIEDVASSIERSGGEAIHLVADATNPVDMEKLSKEIEKIYKGIDFAFLNAGGNIQQQTIENSELSKWKEAVDLNMMTFFLGVRVSAPLMRMNGGGRIVLTGSAMAHHASVTNSSYSVGKVAARMIANTASLELMTDNITVNEFIPGPVKTKQALKNHSDSDLNSPFNNPNEWVKNPEDVTDLILTIFSLPGLGPTSQIFSLARR